MPDPRSPRGQRFPLLPVLSLVTLGLLLGRKSLDAIARIGQDYGPHLLLALGFPRGHNPVPSTLSRLDAAALEDCLRRWVHSRLPGDVSVFSLDGKTVRGSRQGEIPGQHLVSAYAPQAQAVLGQLRVGAKTNEHKAALRLLGLLPLRDRVVIGDAAFCQRDLAEKITGEGGDYVFTVKANQPGLATDIAAGFGFEAAARSIAAAFSPELPPPPPGKVATTVDKGHGRLERRTLRVTSLLTLHQKWPGLKQGFELTRERTEGGQTAVEVVYGITSLSAEEAGAGRLLGLVRDHWRIENCLHWVRDMTLGEDACRVRCGSAPQVLAALRNVAVHLLSREASASATGASRAAVCNRLAARPGDALEVLGFPQLE